jgi:hypothetical protein
MQKEQESVFEDACHDCDRILNLASSILNDQKSIRLQIENSARDFLKFCASSEFLVNENNQICVENFMVARPLVWGYFKSLWERTGNNFWLQRKISERYRISAKKRDRLPLSSGDDLLRLFPSLNDVEERIKDLSGTCLFFDDITAAFQDLDFEFGKRLVYRIVYHENIMLLLKIRDENFRGLTETLLLNIHGNKCPAKYFLDFIDTEELPELTETILKCGDADTVRYFLERFDIAELTECMDRPNSDGETPLRLFIKTNYGEIFSGLNGRNEIFNLLWDQCSKRLFFEYLFILNPSMEVFLILLPLYYDFAASFLINEKVQQPAEEDNIKLFAFDFEYIFGICQYRLGLNVILCECREQALKKFCSDILEYSLEENFDKAKCVGLLRNLMICSSERVWKDWTYQIFISVICQFINDVNKEHLEEIMNFRLSVDQTTLWDYMERLDMPVKLSLQKLIPAHIKRQRREETSTAGIIRAASQDILNRTQDTLR